MKKIINFRPLLSLVLVALISTAMLVYVATSTASKFYIFIGAIVFATLFFVANLLRRSKVFKMTAIALVIVSLLSLNLAVKSGRLDRNLELPKESVLISGKIIEGIETTQNENAYIKLDDVVLEVDGEKREVDGTFIIYTFPTNLNLDDFEIGRIITCKANVTFFSLSTDNELGMNISFLSRGVVATGFAPSYTFSFSDEYNKTLRDKIKGYVHEKLKALDMKHLDIGYSMLFGDSAALSAETEYLFQSAGVTHLLAVSGFHISIIVLILNFILKKLKFKDYVRLPIIFALLGFYVYLCNFSISVIRATLMSVLLMYAASRKKPYDNLSGFSLAMLIVLLINPTNMFSISFVLSFSAVFSIFCLAPPITRLFEKVFHHKFASFLALIISVQFGVAVSLIYYFCKLSVLSILVNLFVVPIVSVAYSMFVIMLIIFLCLPFMSFVLHAYSFVMNIAVNLLQYVSSINFVINFGNLSSYIIVIMTSIIFLLSDFVFLSKKNKAIDALVLFALIAISTSIQVLI